MSAHSLTLPAPVPYGEWRAAPHSASGNVMIFPRVHSPQLANERPVAVYLPPSYRTSRRRYPVLYMHDGQNLFDAGTSYIGVEWGVDETMERLASEKIEAIVVGLWNTPDRQKEYTPFASWAKGMGVPYLDFLVRTVKPLIDGTFRTQRDRAHTGIMGSSLGGLISTFAYFKKPRTFGFMGAMSPAYWPGNGAIYELVKHVATPQVGRIYLDNGTHENSARRMFNFLALKGYRPEENLIHVEEPDGQHDESAWARRLPDALRFLLGPLARR